MPLPGIYLTSPACGMPLVFAHGAGGGPTHHHMDDLANALLHADVSTVRFAFPYMAEGRKIPDRAPKLVDSFRQIVEEVAEQRPTERFLIGGHSMGGRMATLLAASGELSGAVAGVVLFSFPLHPARKTDWERARPLADVSVPMICCQGTRDAMGDADEVQQALDWAGAKAQIIRLEGADHGFKVRKKAPLSREQVLKIAATAVKDFSDQLATLGGTA